MTDPKPSRREAILHALVELLETDPGARITTAVLAQFISWEGGLRGYEFAEQVFGAIQQVSDTLVTDLRGQLRLETHLLDLYADLAFGQPEKQPSFLLSKRQ